MVERYLLGGSTRGKFMDPAGGSDRGIDKGNGIAIECGDKEVIGTDTTGAAVFCTGTGSGEGRGGADTETEGEEYAILLGDGSKLGVDSPGTVEVAFQSKEAVGTTWRTLPTRTT